MAKTKAQLKQEQVAADRKKYLTGAKTPKARTVPKTGIPDKKTQAAADKAGKEYASNAKKSVAKGQKADAPQTTASTEGKTKAV